MAIRFLISTALTSAAAASFSGASELHSFQRIQLTDKYWAEAIAAGDINRDGHVDIVAGPYWYEGPDFKKRHVFAPATHTFTREIAGGKKETIEGYEGALGSGKAAPNDKFVQVVDLNGDGWSDILSIGFPWEIGRPPAWFENPGKGSLKKGSQWKQHVIADQVDNQSLAFIDLFKNGRPVLMGMYGGNSGKSSGRVGYFQPDPNNPTAIWTFHPISRPSEEFQWYTHGLGYGDINGDGRLDILHSDGWWEQPPSIEGDPVWLYHPYPFHLGPGQIKQLYRGSADNPLQVAIVADVSDDGVPTPVTIYGGSQMYVADVNGDGLADVVTSIVAHGYGLAWWEQIQKKDKDGEIQFRRHLIINKKRNENKYGVEFTEMQAVQFADIDGDGLQDIITGKRFWGHGKCCMDPESNDPAVLYWFKRVLHPDKSVEFIPYLIDSDSGAGTQITVTDVNGDGLPDILVANTKGAFAFIQRVRKVTQQEWEKAQAPVLYPEVK